MSDYYENLDPEDGDVLVCVSALEQEDFTEGKEYTVQDGGVFDDEGIFRRHPSCRWNVQERAGS